VSPCATRHHLATLPCRRRASAQISPDVGAFRPTALRRRSSDRPAASKLRGNARGVCVARWYDPATGEFLSVDPDFNETLDAYGYADENPLDGTDPSGLYNAADDSIQCEYDPSACNPSNPEDQPTDTPIKNKVTTSATETVTYPTVYGGGAPQPGQEGIPIPDLTASQQKATENASTALNTSLSAASTLASDEAQASELAGFCKGTTHNSSSECENYSGNLYGLETRIGDDERALQTAEGNYFAAGEALALALTSPPKSPSVWHSVLVGIGIALGVISAVTGVGAEVLPEGEEVLGMDGTQLG
jgi:hypothetical protein